MLSRRDFLKYCGASAGALGLSQSQLQALASTLGGPNAPTVVWLVGSSCSGCSISFLNLISGTAPQDVGEVLIDTIDLAYHPTLMSAPGSTAVAAAQQAYNDGNFILVVEGGIPTAFDGNACWPWDDNGEHVTFRSVVEDYAQQAAAILSVGACASFGGIPSAGPNPTGVQSVSQITGLQPINIPGCPPHPDWIVWVIARLIAGETINLDAHGRPSELYYWLVHSQCTRRYNQQATEFGDPDKCLMQLGCHGPQGKADCPTRRWNNGVNWCIGSGMICMGCTHHEFPFSNIFQQP